MRLIFESRFLRIVSYSRGDVSTLRQFPLRSRRSDSCLRMADLEGIVMGIFLAER